MNSHTQTHISAHIHTRMRVYTHRHIRTCMHTHKYSHTHAMETVAELTVVTQVFQLVAVEKDTTMLCQTMSPSGTDVAFP